MRRNTGFGGIEGVAANAGMGSPEADPLLLFDAVLGCGCPWEYWILGATCSGELDSHISFLFRRGGDGVPFDIVTKVYEGRCGKAGGGDCRNGAK